MLSVQSWDVFAIHFSPACLGLSEPHFFFLSCFSGGELLWKKTDNSLAQEDNTICGYLCRRSRLRWELNEACLKSTSNWSSSPGLSTEAFQHLRLLSWTPAQSVDLEKPEACSQYGFVCDKALQFNASRTFESFISDTQLRKTIEHFRSNI